jgi:small subunit ribosomal protein S2
VEPEDARFIFGERNGIYIIDLEQTLTRVETAYNFVRDSSAKGGNVMFIGTKKQAQDPVATTPSKTGHAVRQRALARRHAHQLRDDREARREDARVRADAHLRRVRRDAEEGGAPPRPRAREAAEEPRRHPGDEQAPDAVFILDTKKEHIAVTEANKLGIPIIAVVDTNVDPDIIQYPIPGNDDAIRANALMARVIAEAIQEGRYISGKRTRRPAEAAHGRGGGGVRRHPGRGAAPGAAAQPSATPPCGHRRAQVRM